jgi:hypothetical protein
LKEKKLCKPSLFTCMTFYCAYMYSVKRSSEDCIQKSTIVQNISNIDKGLIVPLNIINHKRFYLC